MMYQWKNYADMCTAQKWPKTHQLCVNNTRSYDKKSRVLLVKKIKEKKIKEKLKKRPSSYLSFRLFLNIYDWLLRSGKEALRIHVPC